MFWKLGIFSILLLVRFSAGDEKQIYTVQYDEKSFDVEVAKKNHFVMFYAPWCGHCQRLEPIWEQLAEMLNEDEDGRVRIAKVDCTTDNEVCSKHDVTGYPTLKCFKVGEKTGVKFRGTRDLPTLSAFINEQLGSAEDEESTNATPEAVNGPVELTEDNFEDHVSKGFNFVKFYAPWCGHCQKLAPIWDELANSLQYDSTVSISKIDCTLYRKVCGQYDIKGYPTLLWLENGKKVDKYTGQRSHDEFKNYVWNMIRAADYSKDVEKVPDEDVDVVEPVLTLTSDNFEQGISKGLSFVKFFAPWCGHCKRLAPTWNELANKFSTKEGVNIAKVDCTLDVSKQLCNDQEIDGFPTLLLYKEGRKISEYNGSRSLDDLYEFVMKNNSGELRDEL